jgi:hypothetical protein
MASKSWDLTPIQSNLVEGSHSATNAVTSIGQELAEAVNRYVDIYIQNVDLINLFFLLLSARELDKRVACELEAMERNGVLANRWNGPIKREHRSEKRHAWSREKNQTHQELLAQHDALAADLETVSIRHAESIDIDKALQEKIKALRSHQDIGSKQEIKMLQEQIESEKEKRRALKIERTGIKKMMQELKDSGLNGSRINGRRPTSSTPAPTAVNPAPHSDIEKPLPNVHEVPGMSILLSSWISLFIIQLQGFFSLNNTVESLAEASTTNAAPYFNQNYIPILENEPLDHDTCFSGAC